MRITHRAFILASLLLSILGYQSSVLGQGTGTLTQLQQFVASSSPTANITQATWGKAIKITGLTTGLCLTLDANRILTTTSCGTGGGSFAWTPFAWGNSTSTVLGLPGVIITGSSTLSSLGTGLVKVTNGLLGTDSTSYITLASLSATWPVQYSAGAFTWGGLATTSNPTAGNIFYSNGTNGLIPIATSSINVGTASALFANAANCSAGLAAGGVTAAGAAEDCTDYWTEAENTAAGYTTNTGTVTSIATTYPITGGTITTSGTLGIAFGTTTANTWANTQTFAKSIVVSEAGASATSTFAGHVKIAGNLQVDGAFFAPVTLVSSGNATINGDFAVTGQTTLILSSFH